MPWQGGAVWELLSSCPACHESISQCFFCFVFWSDASPKTARLSAHTSSVKIRNGPFAYREGFFQQLGFVSISTSGKTAKKCKKYILESNCGASCIGKGKNLLSTILCAFLYNCCQWAPKSQQHCSIKLLGFEHKRSVAGFKFATTSTTYAKPLCQKTCLGPGGWFKSQFPLIMSRSCSRNLNHEECILNIYIYIVKNVNRHSWIDIPIDPT